MKRVLVISYYWPPGGGSGVQRWLKFTKYLPELGWTPVVYTPENGEQQVVDEALLEDVHPEVVMVKRPIWEPYSLYKKFLGIKKTEKINTGFLSEKKKPGKLESIAVWVRGNLFIPDARKFWIKPSISYLSSYLKENPVDLIISTGPPHSMHLIGKGLKEKTGIPWIADFRDPWTNIDFYSDLKLSKWADKKHHRLEHEVLSSADKVIAVGKVMAKELERLGAQEVLCIPNGYDEADFKSVQNQDVDRYSIVHIGALTKTRNPHALWDAIESLKNDSPDIAIKLKVKLVGKVDYAIMEDLASRGLSDFVERVEYLPHDQVIDFQRSSGLLLLLINNSPNAKGIVTGKIFEYMASERPILCIGPPDGEAADILNSTSTGVTADFDDAATIKGLLKVFLGNEQLLSIEKKYEMYSRKNLAKELRKVMEELSV